VAQEHGIDGQRSYVGKHGTPPGITTKALQNACQRQKPRNFTVP
jgi:hypothetical protein